MESVDVINKLAMKGLGNPVRRLQPEAGLTINDADLESFVSKLELPLRKEYDEAKKSHPLTVSIDTPVNQFTSLCSDDAETAATKLVQYWKRRSLLFGGNSGKLLTATGAGALNSQDIELLNTGFLAIMPEDSQGRCVVCYNRSRLEDDFDDVDTLAENMMRCAFYIMSIVAESEASRTKGVVLLELNTPTFQEMDIDESFRRDLYDTMLSCFPVKLAEMHIVFKFPRIGKYDFFTKIYKSAVETIEKALPTADAYTLFGSSKSSAICDSLTAAGFRKDGIPSIIGGDWKYFEDFAQWKRDRRVTDELIDVVRLDPEDRKNAAQDIISQAQAKIKKRANDIVYARRMRQRGKIEKDTLAEQVEQLRGRKVHLLETNNRLSSLLAMAKEVVHREMARAAVVSSQVVDPQFSLPGRGSLGPPPILSQLYRQSQHPLDPRQQAVPSGLPSLMLGLNGTLPLQQLRLQAAAVPAPPRPLLAQRSIPDDLLVSLLSGSRASARVNSLNASDLYSMEMARRERLRRLLQTDLLQTDALLAAYGLQNHPTRVPRETRSSLNTSATDFSRQTSAESQELRRERDAKAFKRPRYFS